MKKFLTLILTILLVLSLCACKRRESELSETSSDTAPVQTVVEQGESDPENSELPRDDGTAVQIENLTPREGQQNGIDVSKWQGKIDWKKVKNSGIDFAVVRIGYRGENGVIYKDSYADYNLQQAEAAGVLTGVYFFSTAINATESAEEADWVLAQIAGYPISYPVVYDCEGFRSPTSRMYSVSPDTRTDSAIAFGNKIKAAGYESMFYASLNDLADSDAFDTTRIEQNFSIWIAHYPDIPYPTTPAPAYSGKYDMWQYTNRGTVPGISGSCDLVVSYFTRQKAAAKNADSRPDDTAAPAVPDNIYTACNEQVTAKELVNLRDGASTKSNVVGQLRNGETVTRTATGTNGWSKLNWGGQTVYAISSYLTTDISYTPPVSSQPSEFTDTNEQVTAKDETNLRSGPSTDSSIIATIKNGEFVTRTGVSPRGWSRINYNGQTVYAVTSLLTDKVAEPPVSSEAPVSSAPEPVSEWTDVNEQVTAKSETNLRTAPSTSESEVVYTLKNGEYITRTGVSTRGWSRLDYNGQTVYAITSYLTN